MISAACEWKVEGRRAVEQPRADTRREVSRGKEGRGGTQRAGKGPRHVAAGDRAGLRCVVC